MDYEKKYKEALERAKGMWVQGMMPERIEYIFPELKESEDEKTKREIMEYITHYKDSLDDDEYKTWIAWLEKQGEEKVYSVWVGGSEVNDYYLTEKEAKKLAEEYKKDGYDDVIIEKQGERATWSEYDEYQINTILHKLDLKRKIYKKEGNEVEEERYNIQYNWLKSLKERMKEVGCE